MRITAGTHKGLEFSSPQKTSIHPMSEKVRLSLFNTLGDISGLNVLDAYSGSGALAYEAASRGASEVIAIDKDKTSALTIRENIEKLKLKDKIRFIQANISSWSMLNKPKKFNLIIADPPYNNIKINQITILSNHLKDNGLLVLSWPKIIDKVEMQKLTIVKIKKYGDANLVFYRKVS